jgi:hypothetical protein
MVSRVSAINAWRQAGRLKCPAVTQRWNAVSGFARVALKSGTSEAFQAQCQNADLFRWILDTTSASMPNLDCSFAQSAKVTATVTLVWKRTRSSRNFI